MLARFTVANGTPHATPPFVDKLRVRIPIGSTRRREGTARTRSYGMKKLPKRNAMPPQRRIRERGTDETIARAFAPAIRLTIADIDETENQPMPAHIRALLV